MSAPWRAVLTGHSRGLGLGLAEALLAEGAEVLALSRNPIDARAGLIQVPIDLGDVSVVAAWLAGGEMARFVAGAGRAALINNAGTVAPIAPLGEQGSTQIGHGIALNVAVPLMLADGFAVATNGCSDRRLMHISSGAGRKPYPGWSVYSATKAALDMHAQSVQADKLVGMRVESLAPGVIDTDMQAEIRGTPESRFVLRADFQAMKAEGELADASVRGRGIIGHLLSAKFGTEQVTDVRRLGID